MSKTSIDDDLAKPAASFERVIDRQRLKILDRLNKISTKSVEDLSVGDLFRLPLWPEGEYAKVTSVTFKRPYGTPFATVTFDMDRLAGLPNGRVECVFGTRVNLAD